MPAATDIGHGEDPRVMLGRIVYRQRMQLGISQEDLADQVGLDRTYISGIERGIRNPTFLVLLHLPSSWKRTMAKAARVREEPRP
jgi:transcriptional regulator with XRE-family HTH domain